MFKEPLQNAGLAAGHVVAKMDTILDEYYAYMGYDANGVPTAAKLKEFELTDAANEMEKFRK